MNQFRNFQDGRNQQDCIRAVSSRFENLNSVNSEIFAKNGNADGSASRLQIMQRALKIRLIGKHGQARGSALLVGMGDVRWVKIRLKQSLAGRGLLDLSDDGRF